MSKSSKKVMVVSLHDTFIRYIILAKNEYGFYVDKHDSAALEDGVIKQGEILQAEFLIKVLKKIRKDVNLSTVDLVLPHNYFLFDLHSITLNHKKESKIKKNMRRYLKEHTQDISWLSSHAYEYDIFGNTEKKSVLFRALPQEIYRSYEYVFKKAGFSLQSIQSELLSFVPFFKDNKRVSQVFVDDAETYVLEYKNGIFISDKRFGFSYNQCIQDIEKNVHIERSKAQEILDKYGVLRTHPDTKVLRRLERSMTPLFDFFRGRKIKEEEHVIFVHYAHRPIKGFSDRLRKLLRTPIFDLSVLDSPKYSFQDVLSLHKKESYDYEPLITRALDIFSK